MGGNCLSKCILGEDVLKNIDRRNARAQRAYYEAGRTYRNRNAQYTPNRPYQPLPAHMKPGTFPGRGGLGSRGARGGFSPHFSAGNLPGRGGHNSLGGHGSRGGGHMAGAAGHAGMGGPEGPRGGASIAGSSSGGRGGGRSQINRPPGGGRDPYASNSF